MTDQELIYFRELSEHRANLARVLNDPALKGVKTSVVEKYSDQAHFIYELLQNADDAKATVVHFELYKNMLVFKHNGTRRFSISNQKTEEEDKGKGMLGDINAITSIAHSSKVKASIGKFGVGFKSVFQYTLTPRIYDPNIYFEIHNFIVPQKIERDYPNRLKDETIFVFPFDHPERSSDVAFTDVSEKIRSLDYPNLFLKNLQNINFDILGVKGRYSKKINSRMLWDRTVQESITLTKNDDGHVTEETLWLFSRENDPGQTYSVGFFLDEDGRLKSKQYAAFCFFPTKETTNLNFIVHAPFLLTDSREGIRTSEQHNYSMILLLANLSADSLMYLRDIGISQNQHLINDEIFEIIPYDKTEFNDILDKRKISFKPFYEAILKKMEEEELLPTKDGYVGKQEACWANVPQIAELFQKEQLPEISGVERAQWVFVSFGRQDTQRKNKALTEYIESIIYTWLDEEELINGWKTYGLSERLGGITESFVEKQSVEWLHLFYEWATETAGRTKLVRRKPIFLNQNRQAVAAIDENGQIVLFLPTNIDGYTTVWPELLENEKTIYFLNQIGVKKPALRDEIYNHILPIYRDNNGDIDTVSHFRKFFDFYNECSKKESDDFIELISEYEFVNFRTKKEDIAYRGIAKNLYFPSEELKVWFDAKSVTEFVDFAEYLSIVGTSREEELVRFFKDLGIHDEPRILERHLTKQQAYTIYQDWPNSTREHIWHERYLDGCNENIERIIEDKNKELSLLVWDRFVKLNALENVNKNFKAIVEGRCLYFYRTSHRRKYESSEIITLRAKSWLFNRNGELSIPKDLTASNLALEYDLSSDSALALLEHLKIPHELDYIESSHLSEEERAKIRIADEISDIPEEDFKRMVQKYRASKKNDIQSDDIAERETSQQETPEARIAKEIGKRATSGMENVITPKDKEVQPEHRDEDEYTKPGVDFKKKIEKAKERSAHEIARIARLDELTNQALANSKYSYGWFKALLDLEAYNQEETMHSREISISFANVEMEENTSRILVLKQPNRYIPQSIEDLADIPLDLYMMNGQKIRAVIEVVNVKSYTLRAMLKSNVQLDDVDLSLVKEAKIEAKNPVFLIEELRKAFSGLELEADFDMQKNLVSNIEFIFGPPGTGKTTHLAKNVILPLMKEENPRILVLTPTNKAADVLVRRLMDLDEQHSYKQWLVRFGATNDRIIEENGVFYDKTIDIQKFIKNVTVTTIARFPYDFYIPNDNKRLHLSEMNWDYIIIDEASMIPLVNIIYPLYKKRPEKFIIAGDPFQIEPITTADLWKNENIYTLVHLNSFTNIQTIPHAFKVTSLMTQYRSVPEIGSIFNELTYGGVLSHHRISKELNNEITKEINIKPLTLLKFPVSKYESIYSPKRLQNKSNYHIYSALFTFEYVKYVASILEQNKNSFRIGIIAPYRAQADLLDKLISSYSFPDTVEVQAGTIHGFQGDECDMIIALFNPPVSISTSTEMFLNKLNIINVAISRARDYLVIIMPDDDTENVENLTVIKRVEALCKATPSWIEQHTQALEKIIFNSTTYLEDNSFSTSHQLVNVYGKPEKKYEIRSETNAVDLQIFE